MIQGDEENALEVLSAQGVQTIFQLVRSTDQLVQSAALTVVMNLTEFEPIFPAIIAANGIRILMDLLANSRESVQENVLSAFVSLANGLGCLEAIFHCGNVTFLLPFFGSRYSPLRLQALRLLSCIVREPKFLPHLIFDACVVPVTNSMANEDEEIRVLAGSSLVIIMRHTPRYRDGLARSDAVPSMVQLLQSDYVKCIEHSAELLSYIAEKSYGRQLLIRLGILHILFSLMDNQTILSNSLIIQHTMRILSAILSEPDQLQQLLHEGGIPRLVKLLQSPSDLAKIGASAMLGGIATSKEGSAVIIDSGVLPPLFQILRETDNPDLRRQVSVAFNNLSFSSQVFTFVKSSEQLQVLIELLDSEDQIIRETSVSTLFNVCLDEDNWRRVVTLGGIPLLLRLVASTNRHIQSRAAQELGVLTLDKDVCDSVIQQRGLQPLIQGVLSSPNHDVQESGLAAVANLSGCDNCWKDIIEMGGLLPVVSFLSAQDSLSAQLSAVTIIANITSDMRVVALLGEEEVISRLIDMVESAPDHGDLTTAITRALSNLIREQSNARDLYCHNHSLEPFMNLFVSEDLTIRLNAAQSLQHLSCDAQLQQGLQTDGLLPRALNSLLTTSDMQVQLIGATVLAEMSLAGNMLFQQNIPAVTALSKQLPKQESDLLQLLITVIRNLSQTVSLRRTFISEGVMELLVALHDEKVHQALVLMSIANLSLDEFGRSKLTEMSSFLLEITGSLKLGDDLLVPTLLVIKNCSLSERLRDSIVKGGAIETLLEMLLVINLPEARELILDIFELISIDSECRTCFVRAMGIQKVYRLLNTPIEENTLLRITTLFHNLSFDSSCCSYLRESGIISFFIERLQGDDEATIISCLYALHNLMCSDTSRSIVCRELSGISLTPLVQSRNHLISLMATKLKQIQ